MSVIFSFNVDEWIRVRVLRRWWVPWGGGKRE